MAKKLETKVELKGKEELKKLLLLELPTMFDRNPNITGNVDLLVEKIIKQCC